MLVALLQGRVAGKPQRRVEQRTIAVSAHGVEPSLEDFEARLRRRALLRGLGESSPVIAVILVGLMAFLMV